MIREKTIALKSGVDKHREFVPEEAIYQFVEHLNRGFLKLLDDHDPRNAPIGRVVGAKAVRLPDGTLAAEAYYEIFESNDSVPSDLGKQLVINEHGGEGELFLSYDLSYRDKDKIALLEGLRQKLSKASQMTYGAKKSLDPISVLVIGGTFVLGKIFEGFLTRTGEVVFDSLHKELSTALELQKDKPERLLEFDLTVEKDHKKYAVSVILTNPTEEDIKLVLSHGLKALDAKVGLYLDDSVREVALELKNNRLEVAYLVDGSVRVSQPPSDRRIIDILA